MMDFYENILAGIAVWTLIEGSFLLFIPGFMTQVTQRLFPKWGSFLSEIPRSELRKLGGIELFFGLILGGYLLIFSR